MELIKTKQWEDFCFFYENRSQISRSKFKKLKDSIQKTGYIICPILVMPCANEDRLVNLDNMESNHENHKYAIIDGQNRLLACRDLDMEIIVVINELSTRDDIVTANNTSTPWEIADYIKYYDKKGKPQYNKLHELWKEYTTKSFTTSSVIEVFLNSNRNGFGGASVAVKGGDYVVNEEFGSKVLDSCQLIEEVDEDLFRNTKFVRMIKSIMFDFPKFNIEILAKAINRGGEIEVPNDEGVGKKLILDIYEKNLPDNDGSYIPTDLKNWIFYRDGNECQHDDCDKREDLDVDHIQAFSKWGETTASNLRLLCSRHNKIKGNKENL